jgi:hypothetical protein
MDWIDLVLLHYIRVRWCKKVKLSLQQSMEAHRVC